MTDDLTRKDTNPKDRAATARLSLSLVPPALIAYAALAYTEGDRKYRGFNWRVGGVLASVYQDAILRHLLKWADGEDADPVTGVPHLASCLASLGILIDALELGVLVDDRPPKGKVAEVLSRAEGTVRHIRNLYPPNEGRHTFRRPRKKGR